MQRLGLTGITFGEIDWKAPKYREVDDLVPRSDYAVGQRLVLTILVKDDSAAYGASLIAAECKVLEVRFLGSKG